MKKNKTIKNTNMLCPICKNREGYIQQRGYLKEFFCPCCFFSCLMRTYKSQFNKKD